MKALHLILILSLFAACTPQNPNSGSRSAANQDTLEEPVEKLPGPGPTPVPTPPPVVETQKIELKIASINMKGIPELISSDEFTMHNKSRARGLFKVINKMKVKPDVILLQEVFDTDMLAELTKSGEYPFFTTDHPGFYEIDLNVFDWEKGIKVVPSGLLILSKYPIASASYKHFPFDMCEIDDCFAKKGVLMARVNVPGKNYPITFFTTHLQSKEVYDNVRRDQIEEMKKFAAGKFGGIGFFGGDFNFKIGDNAFKKFKKAFTSNNAQTKCKRKAKKGLCNFKVAGSRDEDDTVDHQFVLNDFAKTVTIKSYKSTDKKYDRDGKKKLLSDHPFTLGVYEF